MKTELVTICPYLGKVDLVSKERKLRRECDECSLSFYKGQKRELENRKDK